jgi:hypothetical protein
MNDLIAEANQAHREAMENDPIYLLEYRFDILREEAMMAMPIAYSPSQAQVDDKIEKQISEPQEISNQTLLERIELLERRNQEIYQRLRSYEKEHNRQIKRLSQEFKK